MFSKIQQHLDLKFNEIVTIISSIAIIYILLYKYSLYFFLDIEWYLSLVSLQEIIFSSLMLITLSLISLGISFGFIYYLSKINHMTYKIAITLTIILLVFIIMLIFKKHQLFDEIIYTKLKMHINYIFISLTVILEIYLMYLFKEVINGNIYRSGKIVKIIVRIQLPALIFLYISLPVAQGYEISKVIKETPENFLPRVELKDEGNKWYLLEASKDSALVIKEVRGNHTESIYKVIEMKEIKQLTIKNEKIKM